MKQVQRCPSGELLDTFAKGELSEEQAQAVAAHLDECQGCWKRVQSHTAEVALSDDLKWASELREKTPTDINVPLARLSALLADYEVIGELGRGGMGIVYQARHRKLDRMVALKVLPALLGVVRPDAMARFRREATLAARLKHSNIVAVYDSDEVDGTLFYAMELVEGRSLREILQEINETGAIDVVIGGGSTVTDSATPSPSDGSTDTARTRVGASAASDRAYFRRVAEWVADVADALHYAHTRGVIHRDVKPSNLMLNADGRLMISDFGLARGVGLETLTKTGSLMGTCRYMSPEQLDETRGPIDERVDVYALGATLYELLTFRPLFAGSDDRELLNQVLHAEPTPPRKIVRQVPRELETICLKAVAKDRGARYGSAKALADDLRRWLLDLPIHAQRPSLPARAMKFVRRRKWPIGAAATMTVLLITTSFLYAGYRGWRQEAVAARSVARNQGVQLLIYEAKSDLHDGRYAAGLRKVNEVLSQSPDLAEAQALRAAMLSRTGRHKEAAQYLEDILARDPDSWPAHFGLAMVYVDQRQAQEADAYAPRLAGRDLSAAGIDEKISYHQRMVEQLMPGTAEACLLRAHVERDPALAIELLDRALELKPDNVQILLERSMRHEELEHHDAMLIDARRAITMETGFSFTHGRLGHCLMSLERYPDAVDAYSRAIELDPHYPVWWYQRGLAKYRMGRHERVRLAESVGDLNEAIRLDPQLARAYMMRGAARALMGSFAEGLADCRRALELDPDDSELYVEHVNLFHQAGRWEDLLTWSDRVVARIPDDPRGYQGRAVAYFHTRQYEKAVVADTRAIQLEPDNPENYHERAVAYLHLGENGNVTSDLTAAIRLDPENAEQRYHVRAVAYVRMRRFSDAIVDLTRILEVAPKGWAALLRRGMTYELAGSRENVLADYERVESLGGLPGVYATLWKYLLLRQNGQDEAAADVLSSRDPVRDGSPWCGQLFDFFRGTISAEALLAAATTDDERCEAHYYIGRKALLDGQVERAKDAFAKCVAMNRPNILESDIARALLQQMKSRSLFAGQGR